jgi:hypothetical protein
LLAAECVFHFRKQAGFSKIPANYNLNSVHFVNLNTGYIAAGDSSGSARILKQLMGAQIEIQYLTGRILYSVFL